MGLRCVFWLTEEPTMMARGVTVVELVEAAAVLDWWFAGTFDVAQAVASVADRHVAQGKHVALGLRTAVPGTYLGILICPE